MALAIFLAEILGRESSFSGNSIPVLGEGLRGWIRSGISIAVRERRASNRSGASSTISDASEFTSLTKSSAIGINFIESCSCPCKEAVELKDNDSGNGSGETGAGVKTLNSVDTPEINVKLAISVTHSHEKSHHCKVTP